MDQGRMDTGAYCPVDSMVRETCDCIIGDAPTGAIPLGRLSTVRDSLRRCAYTVIMEAVMSTRKSSAKPAELSQLNLNSAGIDVGATSHFVAVSEDCSDQPVREFAAYTADLYLLAEWLAGCGMETVVMESTGVYWIPLFGVLEERGFQVMLVDPRRIKNVPVRKSDVLDCQWLQQLHTCGLLSGAFRPEAEIRRLRSYQRQRAILVEYASHHIQHMQKALTQMNVKLQHVIRDITGKTGMDIIEAIASGERDPRKLARLRDPRIRADEATIAKSLQGHWREEHIFELAQAVELYRVYQDKIAECDREIEARLEQFEDRSDGEPPAPNGKKRNQKNAPRFDVQSRLYRMTRVDLTRIDGVDGFTGVKGGQRGRHGHDEMGERQTLRILVGTSAPTTASPVAGSSAQRPRPAPTGQPKLCVWRPTRYTAPTVPWAPSCAGRKPIWERLRPSRRRPTSWPVSSTRCCGTASSTWMPEPNTTRVSISIGHCALQNGGPRNSATSWYPYQMPWHLLCPTHQKSRRRDRLG